MKATLLALLALGLVLSGCGSTAAEAAARAAILTTAELVDEVDEANAAAMASSRAADLEAARAASETEAEFRAAATKSRSPYWRVQESVDGIRGVLFAAESFLDAAGAEGFEGIAGCIAVGVVRLVAALEVLEEATGASLALAFRDKARMLLALLEGWGSAACERGS